MAAEKMRVLIVEDDAGVAMLVGRAVEELGCGATIAGNCAQAQERIRERRPDLILLDNALPDMQAAEFLDLLEEQDLAAPFIVTTGHGNEDFAVQMMKRGAIDYLVKDVDFLDKLIPTITRAVEQIKTRRRLREAEGSLQQYKVEMEAIVEAAADGIVTFDGAGHIVTANSALCEMYGYSFNEIAGKHIGSLFPNEEGVTVFPLPGKAGTGEVRKQLQAPREFIATRADGSPFDAEVTMNDVAGSSRRLYLAVIRDISEKKRIERQLLHDAFHDKLTGLPNRALAMNRINHALARRDHHAGHRCAVMFVDLDRFKMVNDTMGHAAGDAMLVEVASRLQEVMRPSDTIARLGGDEFAVVLEDIVDMRNAIHVAERVLKSLEEDVNVRGTPLKTNASLGIALSQDDTDDGEELLRRADIAMYRAKEKGRGRFEIFDIEMHSSTVMMMRLETDLRRAIGSTEITLHYQPVVDLEKRVVAGFEALVRWNRPGEGLVSPAKFVPLAEETGLICDLGRQVLHMACKQNREWKDRIGDFTTISVNLSAYQLQREDVVSLVRDVLKDTGMPTASLKLELTEGAFIDYAKGEMTALDELKKMGVGLAIDDFGTGYSSFGYLGKLPIETIKLDRSFIMGLPQDHDHIAISTAILAMAKAMKLNVIAEGIEHTGQLKFLYDNGCRWAQGYLFSRPVPAEQAEDLLFSTIEMNI
ncbi:MAG: EAL domain-containing protein [Planctomycetes bacterium]|nr:EAL domain-containing protein [Planctomycetota bacterium]